MGQESPTDRKVGTGLVSLGRDSIMSEGLGGCPNQHPALARRAKLSGSQGLRPSSPCHLCSASSNWVLGGWRKGYSKRGAPLSPSTPLSPRQSLSLSGRFLPSPESPSKSPSSSTFRCPLFSMGKSLPSPILRGDHCPVSSPSYWKPPSFPWGLGPSTPGPFSLPEDKFLF